MHTRKTALAVMCLLAVGGLALALSACGSSDDGDTSSDSGSPATADAGKTVEVKAADPSKTVSVAVGDTIEVAVPGNPTTGFQWEVVPGDDDAIEQVGDLSFEPESDAEGAPGIVTIPMKAAKPGSAIVVLKEMPPGEPEGMPANTCAVSFDIGEASGGTRTVKAEAQPQESVEVAQGDTLEVKLPGNASTGYSWVPDPRYVDDALMSEDGQMYEGESDDDGEGLVGSPGVFTLEWKVNSSLDDSVESPRDGILLLKYVAPGDQEGVPDSVWSLWVSVK